MDWKNTYERVSQNITDPSSQSLHSVIELSRSHFNRYKESAIILSGLQIHQNGKETKRIENHCCSYKYISYGKNVYTYTKTCDGVQRIAIQLDKMKSNHLLILIKLSELENLFPSRLIVIPSVPLPQKTQKNRWQHCSGYAMLCHAVLDRNGKDNSTFWNSDDLNTLQFIKTSIVGTKSTPHFGASGKYFSFGANGVYKIDDKKSSVGLYANKKGRNNKQKKEINEKSSLVEDKLITSLEEAVLSHSRLLFNTSNLLSPLMDVAEHMQHEYGNINLRYGKLGEVGLYLAQVCVNASTRDFHTEFDQGPTMICVPLQQDHKSKKFNFCFSLNKGTIIQLKMNPRLCFVFSANFLNHRQECEATGTTPFFNFASYCNKKLFCHVKKSFDRIRNNK